MPDREKVIKGLEELKQRLLLKKDILGYGYHVDDINDALALLREQVEEQKRLVNWLGKFCSHVDQHFQPLPDEQNIKFFRQKMKQQFGWEVSRW